MTQYQDFNFDTISITYFVKYDTSTGTRGEQLNIEQRSNAVFR